MLTKQSNRTRKSTLKASTPLSTLPLHSHQRKHYATPYKSTHNNTTATPHPTLSLYSFTSQRKHSQPPSANHTIIPSHSTMKSKPRSASATFCFSSHSKPKTKNKKSYSSKKKPNNNKKVSANYSKPSPITTEQLSTSQVQNNLSLYRSTRNSLDTHKQVEFVNKISKIFDLVTLHQNLPPEIEVLLQQPLKQLRNSLRQKRRTQIAKQMLTFKNHCSQIIKTASGSDVCLLLRTKLPQSNRWSMTNPQSLRQKQSERFLRQKYFQTLRRKQLPTGGQEYQKLTNIENRLDEFIEKSLKYRKVYI